MINKIKKFAEKIIFWKRSKKIKKLQRKIDRLLSSELVTTRDYIVFFTVWFFQVALIAFSILLFAYFIIDIYLGIAQLWQ